MVTKIRYKMECHRDKVVVRVTSIYDYLIGHGDTGVLLEGDSRLGYHVRHIISSASRPFRGYRAIISARYVRVSSVTWVCLCTHTQQGNDTPNIGGWVHRTRQPASCLSLMRTLDEEPVIQRSRLGTKASEQKTQNTTTADMSASWTSNSIGYSEQTMAAGGM